MSVTERGTRPARMSAAQRREQLLDVTAELAVELGFHAISIEAVARRAGITRPVVYEHFNDLAGLLEAMIERERERALAQLAAILPEPAAGDEPAVGLVECFRGYLEAVRAAPARWRLILMPPEGAPEILRDPIASGRAEVLAILARVAGPGLDSPDPPLTAAVLSAMADEAARLLLDDPREYPAERLIEHARWILARLALAEDEGRPA